jgi:DNA-binding MarR family transcriptional regulator
MCICTFATKRYTAHGMKKEPGVGTDQCLAMRRGCLSMNLRRTERLVTRHYDSYLAGAGVTAVQLPILGAVATLEEPTFRTLSSELELDRTTLSRNVALLERDGLLTIGPSSGPKPGPIALTSNGRRTLDRAYPLWIEAHRTLEEALPGSSLTSGLQFLRRLRQVTSKK